MFMRDKRMSLVPGFGLGGRPPQDNYNTLLKNVRILLSQQKQGLEPVTRNADARRILVRSGKQLLIERPDDLWYQHFVRRRDNLDRGFNSVEHEAYKPMGGDLILDGMDLLQKTLLKDKKLPSKWNKNRFSQNTETRLEKLLPLVQDKKHAKKKKLAIDTAPTAGFAEIHEKINKSGRRRVAVRGGFSYEQHVKSVQEAEAAKDDDTEDNDMVLVSLSNLQFSIPEITRKLKDSDSETESDDDDSVQLQSLDESIKTWKQAKSPSLPKKKLVAAVGVLSDRKRRMKTNLIDYLESIYITLTTLHNMKTRDLKTKFPLSHEQMKNLRKDYTFNAPEMDSKMTPVRNSRNTRMSTDTLVSGTGSTTNNIPFLLQRRRHTMAQGRRKSKWVPERVTAETWEDLVGGDNQDMNNQAIQQPDKGNINMTFNLVCKTLRWKRRREALIISPNVLNIDGFEKEKSPKAIWQALVAQDRNGGSMFDNFRSVKEKKLQADEVVEKSRASFFKLKQALKEESQEQLQKLERERMASFKHKFNLFEEMSPIFEEHRAQMKQAIKLMDKNQDIFEVKPAKWYEDLTAESKATFKDDPQITHVLMKISRFSQMNARTIMHAKARLSLYVMSLPIKEICQIHMQKAIIFVLVNILHGEQEQFQQWIETRKLALVILPET